MNFIEEHKTLVTVIALIAILYLVSRTQVFAMTMARLRYQWYGMGTIGKVVVGLIAAYIIYWVYCKFTTPRFQY